MKWLVPPDPASHGEMWLALAILNALVKVRTIEGLLTFGLILYALICLAIAYVIMRVAILALTRLVTIYRRRAFGHSASARTLQWTLGVFALVGVLGWGLAGREGTYGLGLDMLAVGFLVFVIVCEVTEWRAQRAAPAGVGAVPRDISLDDIVSWRTTVQQANRAQEG